MIIAFDGMLGNQLFQYAFFLRIKHRYPEYNVTMDRDYIDKIEMEWPCIERAFDVEIPYCSSRDRIKSVKTLKYVPSRISSKLGYPKYGANVLVENEINGRQIDKEKKINENSYLLGYWQSESFFYDAKEEVLEKLRFRRINDSLNLTTIEEINDSESVAVHIRRTDYLSLDGMRQYKCLQNTKYYKNAFDKIFKDSDKCKVFVFSDDIEWCKKYFIDERFEFRYIGFNTGLDSWKDLYLMSICDKCIIANSSFSWWGAYLNEKQDIYVPDYIGEHSIMYPDYYPERWKRISI